jgi:anti-sigma factor RsiW
MSRVGGHLGAQVSALVDGQLEAQRAERAWAHVQRCASCRAAVEQEQWLKSSLARMRGTAPPSGLADGLVALPFAAAEPAPWDAAPARSRRRPRPVLAAAGAGTAAMAVVGLGALSTQVDLADPGTVPATIGGSGASVQPTGPATGWTQPLPADRTTPASWVPEVADVLPWRGGNG